ncbi:MAG: hypothetical protein AB7F35_00845 [Acetobacteraceae bacterium]
MEHTLRAIPLTILGAVVACVGFPVIGAALGGAGALETSYALAGWSEGREQRKNWAAQVEATRRWAGEQGASR